VGGKRLGQQQVVGEQEGGAHRQQGNRPEHRVAWLNDDQGPDEANPDGDAAAPADLLFQDQGGQDGEDERFHEEYRDGIGHRHPANAVKKQVTAPAMSTARRKLSRDALGHEACIPP
jgi:hypothetical protein